MTIRCMHAAAIVLLAGCASIVRGGGPQSVSIRSTPAEADVRIYEVATGNQIRSHGSGGSL